MNTPENPSLFSRLFAGYASMLRAVFWRSSGDAHLQPPAGIWTMLAILAVIGSTRNAIAVGLGITGRSGKWYSFDPDIVLAMLCWPSHLLFFGVFLIHGGLRLLRVESVRYRPLLGFFFYLQVLHLLVPFLDLVGFTLDLPRRFHISEGSVMTEYYTNGIAMSLGIIMVWLITFLAVFRVLLHRLRAPLLRTLAVMTVSWLVLVATTYVFFPTFNTVFDAVMGLERSRPPAYWGYAAFFLLTTVVGLIYSRGRVATHDSARPPRIADRPRTTPE